MFYLIQNMDNNNKNNFKNDRIISIAKTLRDNNEKFKIILISNDPFFRYRAEELNLSPIEYFRVYDIIQNISVLEGHPLSIEDLYFAEEVEKIYTPFGVLLIHRNNKIGEVYYNKYGCIECIKYYKESENYFEYYDDRGFLSIKEYLDKSNNVFRREYLNELGENTIIEILGEKPRIIIKKAINNKLLNQKDYRDMNELITDVLRQELMKMNDDNKLIITKIDDKSLNITKKYSHIFPIIRIVTDEDNFELQNERLFFESMNGIRCIVTDTNSKKNELVNFKNRKKEMSDIRIEYIPMFDAIVNLGISNSIEKMIIYWKINEISDAIYEAHKIIVDKLISKSEYSLIIEVNSLSDQQKVEKKQKNIIDSYFKIDSDSDDFKKTMHYIDAKKNKMLYKADELAVEKIRKSEKWNNLVKAINVYQSIEFRIQPTILSITQDFHLSRLYIDINEKNDLKIQSLAISAGIPQITKNSNDYIKNQKNGLVIKEIYELRSAMSFFLKNLSNWNNSLVENIEIIEEFSSDSIIKKWRDVINEK